MLAILQDAPYTTKVTHTTTGAAYETMFNMGEESFPAAIYQYPRSLDLKYSWEETDKYLHNIFDNLETLRAIESFAQKLIGDLVDLDDSFADVINDNIWDLL